MMPPIIQSCLLLYIASFNDAFSISRPGHLRHLLSTGPPLLAAADDEGGAKNGIQVAITAPINEDDSDFRSTLLEHPFWGMTGMELFTVHLPCEPASSSSPPWSDERVALLESTDIACFATPAEVEGWLSKLDTVLDVPNDISDEDRRLLPNGDVVAACACAETAKICLGSGRWLSNRIYYPKAEQRAVEAEGADGGDIDLEKWAASIAQASGDVMERKFWGGGW